MEGEFITLDCGDCQNVLYGVVHFKMYSEGHGIKPAAVSLAHSDTHPEELPRGVWIAKINKCFFTLLTVGLEKYPLFFGGLDGV